MNLLETALILGEGRTLEHPRRGGRARAVEAAGFNDAVRAAIEDALRMTRGKLYGSDGAAARLGLKPGTLQSKMRKLGTQRAAFR